MLIFPHKLQSVYYKEKMLMMQNLAEFGGQLNLIFHPIPIINFSEIKFLHYYHNRTMYVKLLFLSSSTAILFGNSEAIWETSEHIVVSSITLFFVAVFFSNSDGLETFLYKELQHDQQTMNPGLTYCKDCDVERERVRKLHLDICLFL